MSTSNQSPVTVMECGYRKALERIRKWFGEFPSATGPDGREMPYGVAFGSNGERDYMRNVAHEALASPCECACLREEIIRLRDEAADPEFKYRHHSDASWMRQVDQLRAELAAAQTEWRDAVEAMRPFAESWDSRAVPTSVWDHAAVIVARFDAQGGKA